MDPIKPKILFITPVMPMEYGGGPGMRSHMYLKAFQRDYDVYILVLDRTLQGDCTVSDFVKDSCVDIKVIPLNNSGTWYHKTTKAYQEPFVEGPFFSFIYHAL